MDQPNIGARIAAVFRPAAATPTDPTAPTKFKTPSRFMAATITVVLLALFGISYLAPALTVPWIKAGAEFDAGLQQTLLTLLVLAVGYYIGSSKGSAEANDTIRAQVATTPPPVPPAPALAPVEPIPPVPGTEGAAPLNVKIDDKTAVRVQDVPPAAGAGAPP